MEIVRFNNALAEKVPIPTEAWKLLTTPNCELIQLHLQPGECLEPHPNPLDVIFYVVQGKGILQVTEQTQELHAMDSVFISGSQLRSWENTGSKTLILLVLKLTATP